MSNIGFMENTARHLEERFINYVKNKKAIQQQQKKKNTKTLSSKWKEYIDLAKWKMKQGIKSF